MSQTTSLRADDESPLSRFVKLLVEAPEYLKRCIDRDAQAVRFLTEPALSPMCERARDLEWCRQEAVQSGRIHANPRIWTRRDEKRVNWIEHRTFGYEPPGRTARYLRRLKPRSGWSEYERLFQLAIDEARKHGTTAVLCPMLANTNEAFNELIDAARSLTEGGGRSDFDAARRAIAGLVNQLVPYTIPPDAPNSPSEASSETCPPPRPKRSNKGGGAQEKLIAALTKHHQYAEGGCLNVDPIGSNILAVMAKVGQGSANRFFNKWFGSARNAKDGYENYRIACNDNRKLIAILKSMNGEMPRPGEVLFGREVPDEVENPEHQGGNRRKPRASQLHRHDDG